MQKENNEVLQDKVEQISELMYKLDISSSKVEQCAFDSINVTDQVLNGLHAVLELMEIVMREQDELNQAIEMSTMTLKQEEGKQLIHLVHKQTTNLEGLEMEIHRITQYALEANDAARCIEAGVAEQSENIAELIQCNDAILNEIIEL